MATIDETLELLRKMPWDDAEKESMEAGVPHLAQADLDRVYGMTKEFIEEGIPQMARAIRMAAKHWTPLPDPTTTIRCPDCNKFMKRRDPFLVCGACGYVEKKEE